MKAQRINTHKEIGHDGGHAAVGRAGDSGRFTESLWCGCTFVLFLLLGPFSAIAVLIGLFNLAGAEQRARMVEPASV